MPEFVSGGDPVETGIGVYPARARLMKRYESRRPYALLIGSAEPAGSRNDSLGHQYLLGFIPFTRVFYEHGPQRLAEETTAQVLAERNYRVLRVSPEHFPVLAAEVSPALVVRARLEDFRVNAYDALLVRRPGVSGALAVDFYSPETFEPVKSAREPIDESEYRRQAHAPALAAMAERAVRTAMDAALAKAPGSRRSRATASAGARARATEPSLWLLSPAFASPPPPALGTYVSASYGFESVAPYRTAALARIIQRGIEEALASFGAPVISALGPIDEAIPLRALRPEVGRLTFDASGNAVLEIRLTELLSGIPSRSMFCAVQEPTARGVDGAAVVGIERAAAAAAEEYFGRDRPEAECRSG